MNTKIGLACGVFVLVIVGFCNGEPVRAYGSTDITTIGGYSYYFSGRGEFDFLKNNNGSVTIQIRKEYEEKNKNKTGYYPTYITAVAIKVPNTTFELHLNSSNSSILVYVGGIMACDTNNVCIQSCNGTSEHGIVLGQDEGKNISIVQIHRTFGVSNLIVVQAQMSNPKGLEILIKHPKNVTGYTGLAGNAVEKSVHASKNSSMPLEEANYNYGNSCRLPNANQSIFNYTISKGNFSDYNQELDKPVFLESLVDLTNLTALFKEANMNATVTNITNYQIEVCKNNTQCLLAIARNQDVQAGRQYIERLEKEECQQQIKENVPPEFMKNVTTNITLTYNMRYSLNLSKYTRDNNTDDILTYTLTIENVTVPIENGVIDWNVTGELREIRKATPRLQVTDKFDKHDSVILNVTYCGCEHGEEECDFNNYLRSSEYFRVASCNCIYNYSTGDFCNETIPICDMYNCLNGCNNSMTYGQNPCWPCKDGFSGDGQTCADVDECSLPKENRKCEQNCTNTEGSFQCSCFQGYTLNPDNETCSDIDECHNKTICNSIGDSICQNTNGSYECNCKEGKVLKNNSCQNATSLGTHFYFSSLRIEISTPLPVATLNDTAKEDLRESFEKELNQKFNETFEYIKVTSVTYITKNNTVLRVARDTSGAHFEVNFTIFAKESLNSSSVSNKIEKTLDTAGVSVTFNILDRNLTVGKTDFCMIPDENNHICTSNVLEIQCNNKTTSCQTDNGSYKCACKEGYKPLPGLVGKYACEDIDECSFDNITTDMCVHGQCHNLFPSWECRCPNTVYSILKEIKPGEQYRCEGDFVYPGSLRFLWIDKNQSNSSIISYVNETLQQMFNNGSIVNAPTPYPPMYEVFMRVDEFNMSTLDLPSSTLLVNISYLVHLGERLPNEYVKQFLDQMSFVQDIHHAVNIHSSGFNDSEMSICNFTDKVACVRQSTTCKPVNGSYTCECKPGYNRTHSEHEYSCEDIDECRMYNDSCANHGRCQNLLGDWTCNCSDGYRLKRLDNGTSTCEDIDECNNTSGYHCQDGQCNNRVGGWDCLCDEGYEAQNISKMIQQCIDKDECKDEPTNHTCTNNGTCNNIPGNWTCNCPHGTRVNYVNDNYIDCEDIDECNETDVYSCSGPDNSANCNNSLGGWSCGCKPGFRNKILSSTHITCEDLDECHDKEYSCNGNGHCTNTNGGWYCDCQKGYTNKTTSTKPNNVTCTNIDECSRYPNTACINGKTCLDKEGDWTCICNNGFRLLPVNDTAKICKEDFTFTAVITFQLLPFSAENITYKTLETYLKDQVQKAYETTLNDKSIWVEILRILNLPSNINRPKRSTSTSSIKVEYKIHSEEKRNQSMITAAVTNSTRIISSQPISFSNDSLVRVFVNAEPRTEGPCIQCDADSTNCNSSKNSTDAICTCKEGFVERSIVAAGDLRMCEAIDCSNTQSLCQNGDCHRTTGQFTCNCHIKGTHLLDYGNATKVCVNATNCTQMDCGPSAICEQLTTNPPEFKCKQCPNGKVGTKCIENTGDVSATKNSESDAAKSKQKILITSVSASLGGLVVILVVAVIVVCRMRQSKVKEVDQLKNYGGSDFRLNEFGGSAMSNHHLSGSKLSLHDNGFNRFGSNQNTLPRPRIELQPMGFNQNGHVTETNYGTRNRAPSVEYGDPRKYKDHRHETSFTPNNDQEGHGRLSRSMQNQGMVRVLPDEGDLTGRLGQDRKTPKHARNGRSSPPPDYNEEPAPDYGHIGGFSGQQHGDQGNNYNDRTGRYQEGRSRSGSRGQHYNGRHVNSSA